jgi:Ca2+-binding RTX toxin-like protein
MRMLYRFVVLGLVALVLASVMSAMAATNTVPKSGLSMVERSVTANDLKPAACNDLNLSNVIAATGAISGTTQSDLILGGPGADTISGESGNDCILGGGGSDHLYGDSGTDVCIGGAAIDLLDDSCETRIE